MNLPLRLKTIGDLIEDGEYVADIGADHGLLELYLLGKCPNIRILAIENKKGPFKNLSKTVSGFKNVELSLSDGLNVVNKDVTTLVFAGMGGLNIKNIIEANSPKLKNVGKIITDAHRDLDVSRKLIVDCGYKIHSEQIVFEEEKFYVITEFIKVEEKPNYSEDEFQFGYKIYEDKLWSKYKEYLKEKNNNLILKLKENPKLQDKVLETQKINERLENYGKN